MMLRRLSRHNPLDWAAASVGYKRQGARSSLCAVPWSPRSPRSCAISSRPRHSPMSLFYSQKMNQSSSLMASLLRQQMKRELRRLDAADRDRALRKAHASRQRTGAMAWDPMAAPCPWWSAADARAHAAWLHSPVSHPISWEELDPCQCLPLIHISEPTRLRRSS